MSNLYQTLRDRQQAEVNDYLKEGAFFAFSDKQFKAGLEKLGIAEEDAGKRLSRLGSTGGYMVKERVAGLKTLLDKNDQERQKALDDPETGRQFAFDMFFYELNNHEYIITMSAEETLDALGLTWEDIKTSAILSQELNRAENEIMKNAQENGFI